MDDDNTHPNDRPVAYEEGGRVFYRASALGSCTRMLALARQGYDAIPPPPNMQAVFDRGHQAEQQAWVKGILTGVNQQTITLKISNTIYVTGHLDSFTPYCVCGEGRVDCCGGIVELKSQSEAEWGPIELSAMWGRYSYQISAYMHAYPGVPLTVRRVKVVDGEIVDTVDEVYTTPPRTMQDIRTRIFEVERLARMDLTKVQCENQYPCPYFYTHVNDDNAREYVDDQAALILVKQYKQAQKERKDAEGRVKASQQALLTFLGDRDRIELPGHWLVTRYKVERKERLAKAYSYEALKVTEPKEDTNGTDDQRES